MHIQKKDWINFNSWFENQKRDLPFRKNKDPYRVWVSEIMLQQTRMSTILKPYQKFIEQFPNIKKLAQAKEEEVLFLWRGLGYYSRAKNLHKASKEILERHKGIFPRSYEEIIKLSGIGSYTASAILSICFNQKYPVIDGNVKRIITRLVYNLRSVEKEIPRIAQEMLEENKYAKAGEHNQAMMELGSLICTPKKVKCFQCPFQTSCKGFSILGSTKILSIPPKVEKKYIETIIKVYLLISLPSKKILIIKEKESYFFKNLWFFPSMYLAPKKLKIHSTFTKTPNKLPLKIEKVNKQENEVKHSITKHKIKVEIEKIYYKSSEEKIFTALKNILAPQKKDTIEWKWLSEPKLKKFLVSSLSQKILKFL